MKNLINTLNLLMGHGSTMKIVACCCGHFKYPMTIVVINQFSKKCSDLVSDTPIPRSIQFYKKDEEGIYFIPETIK